MPTFANSGLSEIIARYRNQVATHATALASHDDDKQLIDATYGPSMAVLENPPAVCSRSDAVAALELALEDTIFTSRRDEALVRSTLDWLREN